MMQVVHSCFVLTGLLVTACTQASSIEPGKNNPPFPDSPSLLRDIFISFTPKCIDVFFGTGTHMEIISQEDLPFDLILNTDNKDFLLIWGTFLKNIGKIATHSCVNFIFYDVSRIQAVDKMVKLSQDTFTNYYFGFLSNSSEVGTFLLDSRLRDQEHLAALVFDNNKWRVYNRLLLTPSWNPLVQQVAIWSPKRKLRTIKELFPSQMKNFYGMKMTAVTLDFPPFIDYTKQEGSLEVITKDSVDIFMMDAIAQKLNLTYRVVVPPDGLYGLVTEHGNFSGVVGEVFARRANFSLDVSVTFERRLKMDFSSAYFVDVLTFVMGRRRIPRWMTLVIPFDTKAWIAVLSSLVATAVVYGLMQHSQKFLERSYQHFGYSFFTILGTFMGQNVNKIPKTYYAQILLGIWLLTVFILSKTYQSTLTAAFAVPVRLPKIDTLEGLLKSSLEYGMTDAKGAEYQLMSTTNVALYRALFKKMQFLSPEESMRRVSTGYYAFVYFKSNIKALVSSRPLNDEVEFHIASEGFFPGPFAWVFPKGVPYRQEFDKVMQAWVTYGLVDYWLKNLYESYRPHEREENGRESNQDDSKVILTLTHLQGIFFLYIIGTVAGIFVFFLELLYRFMELKYLT